MSCRGRAQPDSVFDTRATFAKFQISKCTLLISVSRYSKPSDYIKTSIQLGSFTSKIFFILQFIHVRRMNFTDDDIEEWVKKTDAVEKAIRGIADGTIDYNSLNLEPYSLEASTTQYGEVLQNEKGISQIKAMDKNFIDKAESKQHLEETKERETWWEGARVFLRGCDSKSCSSSSSPRTVAVTVRANDVLMTCCPLFKKAAF